MALTSLRLELLRPKTDDYRAAEFGNCEPLRRADARLDVQANVLAGRLRLDAADLAEQPPGQGFAKRSTSCVPMRAVISTGTTARI